MTQAPAPTRRHLLALAAATLGLTACALPGRPRDRIVEVATGRERSPDELRALAQAADFVLLGEQHDNPHHHQRRGQLIAQLGPATVVVAEHLAQDSRVGPGQDVRSRLEAAGFDAKAWRWPVHDALFAPVLAAGLPVIGGNAPQALVRQIAREGTAAWPPALRQALEAAPLEPAAQAALDQALTDGHCGQLPAARVPAMRAAQRSRDASMALALLACGGRPAVLVAGNGHVGLEYGVAQLLRRMRPQARVLSVGFGEPGSRVEGAPYGHLWITGGVDREDPCAGFKLPPPSRA